MAKDETKGLQRKRTEQESYNRKLPQLNQWWPIVIKGTTLQAAGGPALLCTGLAVIITIVHYVWYSFKIESQGHTITIFPVSLLLVFRTNISHSRYWEGRGHIGAMVHHCRDLLRKARVYFPEHAAAFAPYIVCFPRAVRWDLHSSCGKSNIAQELPELSASHKEHLLQLKAGWPMAVMRMLEDFTSALCVAKQLHPAQQVELHQHLDGLQAAWEGMRKIQTTPLPFPYAHLAKFLIYAWCLTLPFGLVKTMTYLMPFTVFVMSLSLFGLNQVGVEIEMPFGVDLNDFLLYDYEAAVERDAVALTTIPPDSSITSLFPSAAQLLSQIGSPRADDLGGLTTKQQPSLFSPSVTVSPQQRLSTAPSDSPTNIPGVSPVPALYSGSNRMLASWS